MEIHNRIFRLRELEKEKADLAKAVEDEKLRLQMEKEKWEKQQLKELEELPSVIRKALNSSLEDGYIEYFESKMQQTFNFDICYLRQAS